MNPNFTLFTGSAKVHLGGDSRGRTGDLLNAIQALYQLRYTPICDFKLPATYSRQFKISRNIVWF